MHIQTSMNVRVRSRGANSDESLSSLDTPPPLSMGKAFRQIMTQIRRNDKRKKHCKTDHLNQITRMFPVNGGRKRLSEDIRTHAAGFFVYHQNFLHLTHFM